MALPQRELGKSGIKVSAEGLGLMSLSGTYGPSDDAAGIALIHEALDRGVTFLDSSDAYGKGHNETLLGNALKGRRAGVVVATKFGNLGGAGGKFADGRPEFVISSCEASLKRLGIDVIDLYYQHRVDPEVPIEDTVGAMKKLVEQGKVRALGLSEAAPETIRRAHKVHPIAAVQSEYSLLYRAGRRRGAEHHARARHFVRRLRADRPRAAQRRDRRSGDADRRRHPQAPAALFRRQPRAQQEPGAEGRGDGEAEGLHGRAARDRLGAGAGPGSGADPRHQAVKKRLAENLGALDVKLTPADVASLSAAVPPGAAKGTRYPEGQMKSLHI